MKSPPRDTRCNANLTCGAHTCVSQSRPNQGLDTHPNCSTTSTEKRDSTAAFLSKNETGIDQTPFEIVPSSNNSVETLFHSSFWESSNLARSKCVLALSLRTHALNCLRANGPSLLLLLLLLQSIVIHCRARRRVLPIAASLSLLPSSATDP